MWARKGSDSSKERLGNQARKNLSEPKTLHARLTPIGGGTAQRVGCPVGGQVRPVPHSTDSKNTLKHLPPRRQEHSRIDEKGMEAPTDPDELTFSTGGLAGHVILPLM
jgi:hypothetical protein